MSCGRAGVVEGGGVAHARTHRPEPHLAHRLLVWEVRRAGGSFRKGTTANVTGVIVEEQALALRRALRN